jgi:hypothetical protein
VMRVSIEQLPALQAALGEHGRLEVLGSAEGTCTVVVWRNDGTTSPTDAGRLGGRPSSLPLSAWLSPDLGSETTAQGVAAGRAVSDPNLRWLGRRLGHMRSAGSLGTSRRVMVDNDDRDRRIGLFPTGGESAPVGPGSRVLVTGRA